MRTRLRVAVLVTALPLVARAEVVNPGTYVWASLLSPWGIAASLVLGWLAMKVVTGRTWLRAVRAALAVKAVTTFVGPILLALTGGFVLSFSPAGLVASGLLSALFYTGIDLASLRIFVKQRPSYVAFASLFVANGALLAIAAVVFVTLEHDLWLRVR